VTNPLQFIEKVAVSAAGGFPDRVRIGSLSG
jgi:hypothetical protein